MKITRYFYNIQNLERYIKTYITTYTYVYIYIGFIFTF